MRFKNKENERYMLKKLQFFPKFNATVFLPFRLYGVKRDGRVSNEMDECQTCNICNMR